jgi:hypothetical protein
LKVADLDALRFGAFAQEAPHFGPGTRSRRVEAIVHRKSALAFLSTSSADTNVTSPASIGAAR